MAEPITDKRGTVFDPARHLHREGVPTVNRLTGCFMPRGGRHKSAAASAGSSPAGNGAAINFPTEQTPPPMNTPPPTTPPTAGNPAPSTPPPAAAAANAAPSFDDLKSLLGEPPPAPDSTPKKDAPPPIDRSADAAEVFCRAVQMFTGWLFGSLDDCRMAPAEAKDMTAATAAYVRAKGWQFTAGAAFALLWIAYFLRVLDKPAPAAKVRQWCGMTEPKQATPAGGPKPAKADAGPGALAPVFTLPPTNKLG